MKRVVKFSQVKILERSSMFISLKNKKIIKNRKQIISVAKQAFKNLQLNKYSA